MRVEAIEIGQVRVEQVRVLIGSALRDTPKVTVLVFDHRGRLPSLVQLELVDKRAGRGVHRAFVCPGCRRARELLLTDGLGSLRCRTCLGELTRRQREHNRADWRRGGRDTDALLRAVGRRDRRGLARARALAGKLVQLDHQRLALIAKTMCTIASSEHCG